MNNKDTDIKLANNHISVDCVVIGFDGDALRVLLIHRQGEDHGGFTFITTSVCLSIR